MLFASAALLALAACDDNGNIQEQNFDWTAQFGSGFDNTDSRNLATGRHDDRGVISYPTIRWLQVAAKLSARSPA
jgi:hypothetical protein